MPANSPNDDIFDTGADYNMKIVSHGSEIEEDDYKPLADGTKISFPENTLKGFALLDERNLINCLQLNLSYSSLTSLCTMYLSNLRVLRLSCTKIRSL